ncbi:MAG: protein kinase [Phycisphaerales bacterium]
MDILGDVLDVGSSRRPDLIAKLCGEDAELRQEVERLLSLEGSARAAIPDSLNASQLLTNLPDFEVTLGFGESSDDNLIGKRIGAYTIDEFIGRGGMGVVYRGVDHRLSRPVAVKVLPASFASDTVRMARFSREAQLLASLSHPNIASVYGLEEDGVAQYLVMELIEGQTLAERLAREKMQIADVLQVAIQIAEALSCAHDAGVVHRDLKPANVMLTPDDRVKVLDFGLARSVPISTIEERTSAASLDSLLATAPGSFIGTPRYMSPEQVRGLSVDKRTDIFAFGCVLFEMLSGVRAFDGSDRTEVAAAILEREPDYNSLPIHTPPLLIRLIKRMLEKAPSERLRDSADAMFDLKEMLVERAWLVENKAAARARAVSHHFTSTIVVGFVLGIVGGFVGWYWASQQTEPPPVLGHTDHFSIDLPGNEPQNDLAHLRVSISRDGSHIALSASDGNHRMLWCRSPEDTAFQPIEDSVGGWIPSFSPDGQWLSYHHDGRLLKRRIAGGKPSVLTDLAGYWGRFTWGDDEKITFVPVWGKGVARLPINGGEPKFVSHLDFDNNEFAHLAPSVTPDNRTILFAVWDGKHGTHIDAMDLDGSNRHTVIANGHSPRPVMTPKGAYVLFARSGTVYAVGFDQISQACIGSEKAIVDGVLSDRVFFSSCFDVADDGTLVYIPGPEFTEQSDLAWLNDDGTHSAIEAPSNSYTEPRVSKDGNTISFLIKAEQYWPCIFDTNKNTFDRVVTDGDTSSGAISPDGRYLAYSNNRSGPYSLYIHELATGADKLLAKGSNDYLCQISWSADSRYIAFSMSPDDKSKRDVWVVDAEDGEMKNVCNSPAEERTPRFSPDGRWLAYISNDTGTREVRVRKFPEGSPDRQLTSGGADWPDWSSDGNTLYYRQGGRLWGMPMENGSVAGQPTVVYDRDFGQSDFDMPDYTTAPDGRILIVRPANAGPLIDSLCVITNWPNLIQP